MPLVVTSDFASCPFITASPIAMPKWSEAMLVVSQSKILGIATMTLLYALQLIIYQTFNPVDSYPFQCRCKSVLNVVDRIATIIPMQPAINGGYLSGLQVAPDAIEWLVYSNEATSEESAFSHTEGHCNVQSNGKKRVHNEPELVDKKISVVCRQQQALLDKKFLVGCTIQVNSPFHMFIASENSTQFIRFDKSKKFSFEPNIVYLLLASNQPDMPDASLVSQLLRNHLIYTPINQKMPRTCRHCLRNVAAKTKINHAQLYALEKSIVEVLQTNSIKYHSCLLVMH